MAMFEIRIEKQHWLKNLKKYDLCSHGKIYLEADNIIITSEETNEEWGISESALALLRTLKYNHPDEIHRRWQNKKDNMLPSEDYLIYHGCGTILMLGCPININWQVTHENNYVILSNFTKCYSTDEANTISYPIESIKLPMSIYKEKILKFALQAKSLFGKYEKVIKDDYDKLLYTEFWKEYKELIEYARKL